MNYLKTLFFALVLVTACAAPAGEQTYQDLDVAAFKNKMNDADVVLIDVRTPMEIAAGKIPNALEIDIQSADFKQQIEALDKDKTYLVYCKSGGRSARACGAMQEMGFAELYNLEGGFTAFSKTE